MQQSVPVTEVWTCSSCGCEFSITVYIGKRRPRSLCPDCRRVIENEEGRRAKREKKYGPATSNEYLKKCVEEERKARAAGMTYGQWRAMQENEKNVRHHDPELAPIVAPRRDTWSYGEYPSQDFRSSFRALPWLSSWPGYRGQKK